MILDILENGRSYLSLDPGFAAAFEFLMRPDLKDLPDGRHEIDGDRIYALAVRGPGRKREEAMLEAHELYADIQLVLAGVDTMGWKPTSACVQPADDYDPATDAQFFKDDPDAWVATRAGAFVIFLPGDAHLPTISDGDIHKVVAKIRLAQ